MPLIPKPTVFVPKVNPTDEADHYEVTLSNGKVLRFSPTSEQYILLKDLGLFV